MQPAGPYNGGMFFFTYLARELRRRPRQAVFIALGLAVGVGLVVTVTAASAGVKNAQAGVLKGLYGVGTDITVTGPAPSASQAKPGSGSGSRVSITMGPNGAQMCVNGKCRSLKDGYTIDTLASSSYAPMNEKAATEIAARRGVAAAAGGLLLNDNRTTISQNPSPPTSFSVDGTDISQQKLGPLSDAVTKTGRTFKPADANQNVAVVDANYATSNGLKTGGTITIGGAKFTIIGTVAQPEGSNPPNVYIPLARAQSLAEQGRRRRPEGRREHGLRHRGQRGGHSGRAERDRQAAARAPRSPRRAASPARSPARCRPPRSSPTTSASGCPSSC